MTPDTECGCTNKKYCPKHFNEAVRKDHPELEKEWEKHFEETWEARPAQEQRMHLKELIKIIIREAISSRDTYWKERVEEIYSHFSWCQECAEGPMCKDALAIKDNLK